MKHLEEDELYKLALGELPPDAQGEAAQHLETCERCAQLNARLKSTVFSRTAPGSGAPVVLGGPTRPDRPDSLGDGVLLQRGATLGPYVLLEKLGAGGMGEVFAAYDPRLDRKIALKLLRSGSLSAEEGRARLLREAQAMARLQHPNVIAVHDVGTLGDRVFVAMEFVDGETVGEWLRAGRSWKDVIDLFCQAGAGLAAAHSAGLVHRDFKPDNVLIGQDQRPRVLDFGLARQTTSGPVEAPPAAAAPEGAPAGDSPFSTPLTRDGAVMGTPGYMAPEQLAGVAIDARSDQFSFCVALYEALYGQRPFGGATLRQHSAELERGKVPPPPSDSQVPAWVYPVLVRGLDPDPAKRWPDMQALLAALKPAAPRPSSRSRSVTVALLATTGLAVGSALWARQRLSVCGGQDTALRQAWNEETKGKIEQAFRRTDLPLAREAFGGTVRALDAWAGEWSTAAREVCEATRVRKVESAEVMDLRQSCLDEQLHVVRSFLSILTEPDRDVVLNAPVQARSLRAPLDCLRRQPRHDTVSPEQRRAELSLSAELADAQALFGAGKDEAAAQKLQRALELDAPSRALAEGWLLLARVHRRLGDTPAATAAALAAGEHALKAGTDDVLAVALSLLAVGEGTDDAQADRLERLAAAAAARVPQEWAVQAELARTTAVIDLRAGRPSDALEQLQRALGLQREHLPGEHPEVAVTLNELATVLVRLGRYDEAIATSVQSLQIHEEVEGASHPNTATAAATLARTYRLLGRFVESRPLCVQALEARRVALGERHPATLDAKVALAQVDLALGQLDEAGELLGQVRAVREEAGPSPELWAVQADQVELSLASHQDLEAQRQVVRLVALAKALSPGDSRLLVRGQVLLARALTGLGSWPEARAALGEATAGLGRLGGKVDLDGERVEAAEALGRLELAQGRPSQAVAALTQAADLREVGAVPSRGLALLLVDLSRAELETGQALQARTHAERAVALLEAMQAGDPLVRARLMLAMAQALEVDAGPVDVEDLLEALPERDQAPTRSWARKHGSSVPDAGDGGR